MRNTGPKTRLARRAGEPLREKDAKIMQKRGYPPGMHGQSRRRMSEYGEQLLEKQKAKWIYGLAERQFHRYAAEAARKKEVTGPALLEALELRLDNVVYRLGFSPSRAGARQFVSHGFVTVNGKRVNVPSFRLKVGDTVAVAEAKKPSKLVQAQAPKLKDFKPLEWLQLEPAQLSGKVLSQPTAENTASTLRLNLIIEHYSR